MAQGLMLRGWSQAARKPVLVHARAVSAVREVDVVVLPWWLCFTAVMVVTWVPSAAGC